MIGILRIGCDWCGTTGYITDDHRCGKCGRSDNLKYEQYVDAFTNSNEKLFVNWKTYDSRYERRLKERMAKRG